MHYVITFESNHFDLKNERVNEISSIHGLSVGEWLLDVIKDTDINVSEMYPEDWGWACDVTRNYQKYLLGFIALLDKTGNERPEIIILVEKKRKLMDRLKRKNQMTDKDEFLIEICKLVKELDDVDHFSLERNG